MKKTTSMLSLMTCVLALSACQGGPKMFWPVDEKTPAFATGNKDNAAADSRAPLDVPPELRDQVAVPMPDKVAVEAAQGDVKMTPDEKQAIAGKAISVDTRLYDKSAPEVFSAVIDAMTSLNQPVESVDSPSGTITTAWVRQDATTASSYMNSALNMIGAGGPLAIRYRYIVRVFRMQDGKTQLQVRTLGQEFINRHWAFKALKRKVANELFSAIEERLAVNNSPAVAPDDNAAPATTNP